MNYFKKIFLYSLLCTSVSLHALSADAPSKKLVDKTIAIVNQDILLYSEFQEFKKVLEAEQKRDPKNHETDHQLFDKKALDQMIEEKLVEQQIQTLGLEATEAQVESIVDEVMKNNGLQTRRELDRALQTEGMTYDEFIAQYKKRIARSNLVNQTLRPKIKIPDDEVEAEYTKRVKSTPTSTEYLVSMIFISAGNTTLKKMTDLQHSLHSLQDFSDSAGKVTEGPGKESGGSMGWVELADIQEPLNSALKKMKKGDISPVLQNEKGFYILACIDQKTKATQESEKVKDEIREDMMNVLLVKNLNQYILDLKQKAHIEIFL